MELSGLMPPTPIKPPRISGCCLGFARTQTSSMWQQFTSLLPEPILLFISSLARVLTLVRLLTHAFVITWKRPEHSTDTIGSA